LQNPLNKVFSFEYLVTGKWDDPKVEKISRSPLQGAHRPNCPILPTRPERAMNPPSNDLQYASQNRPRVRVAAVQMVSTPRVDENLRTAATLIAEAVAQGAALVALPEYFPIMGMSDADKVRCANSMATARSRIFSPPAPVNTRSG
jgi:hypothetical protein